MASLQPDGWRRTAWVAGGLPTLLGVSSLLYADATSGLGLAWALAAIAWGAGFVAAAELTKDVTKDATKDADGTTLPSTRGPLSRSARG